MALDTNIALGVRPIEQPNMLAQMGQMMQLRQLKQEYEGTNALRDAFATGGDFSDPAFRQRVREANPKMAFDLEAKYLTGEKTRAELLGTAYKNSKEFLTLVNSPEGLREYTISQFSDPIIGPSLKARGITPEKALANLDKEIATTGFNTVLKKSAVGLDRFFIEEMQTDRSRISAAPGHRQANIAEQRFALERTEQENIARILRGEPPIPTGGAPVAPMTSGGGGVAPMTGGGATPPTRGTAPVVAPMSGAAPIGSTPMPVATAVQPNVNGLNVNPAAPITPNVNGLTADAIPPEIAQIQTKISQLINSGSPKAIAAADALIKQHNMLMPSQKIVQNQKGEYIRVDQRSGVSTPVIDASGQPLVGKLPPPVFESEYAKLVGRSAAERDVALVTSANTARENLPKLY